MLRLPRLSFLLVPLLLAGLPAYAGETVYVTDRLVVAIRAKPGADTQMLDLASSGMVLEVLARRGEYTRVRTPEGVTGWVPHVYLSPEPTAALRLSQIEVAAAAPTAQVRGHTVHLAGGRRAVLLSPLTLTAAGCAVLALVALGFGTGQVVQQRRERRRLHGLRL